MMAQNALRELCGSESRYRLFRTLYASPEQEFHLRGLAAAAEVDPGQLHKLLPRIIDAGLCEKLNGTPYARYRANKEHPLFEKLKGLFGPDRNQGQDAAKGDIDLRQAPVLRSLLWSGRERDHIPAREAFSNYERNWRIVRREKLEPQEKELIEQLSNTFGGGLING